MAINKLMQKQSSDPDEAKLIEQVKEGDEAAFSKLVHLHYNRVYQVAYGIVRNEANALDVTQKVWVKVWQKIDTFKGDSAFSTWVYRIATFSALDFVRANKKHQKLDSIDESSDSEEIKTIQIASDTPEEQPLEALNNQEIMTAFKHALSKLKEHHRAALVLRELEGKSYEEIAEIVDCKIGTVMSRIFNARKAIQTHMKDFK
jgi:RNA polymerase sigma-70 factor (ECF subfamily)